jgi:4-hydroxy-tetrahydrodipicolinate synthase
MVTPFKSNFEVDYEEATRLATYLTDHGSDAIVLSGTTGESPTLTHEEEFQLYKVIVKALKGKVKIIAGTGSNSTQTAIQSTQLAEQAGVDASLQVTPYYNKPPQEGLIQHFTAIANATSLPLMLYNIPSRTGVTMLPETIKALSGHPRIVALKEAAGSVEQLKAIKQSVPDDFYLYSGDDALTLPFLKEGSVGVVSVASHICGPLIQEMIQAYNDGNIAKAETCHQYLRPLCDSLFLTTNPIMIKAALNLKGFNVGHPRLPLIPATDVQKNIIHNVLVSNGF